MDSPGGRDQPRPAAEGLAREIKYRLRQQLGECITCSVGIAPNTFLAKTASDMVKPDGLVVIEPGDLPDVLMPLKLNHFVGIGRKDAAAAQRSRHHEHAATACRRHRQMRDVWGGVEGEERFGRKLRGEDVQQRETNTSLDQPLHVLAPDKRSHTRAQAVLSRLTKGAMRLRDSEYVATDISIYLAAWRRKGKGASAWDATDRTPAILHTIALRAPAQRPQRTQHAAHSRWHGAIRPVAALWQSLSLFDAQPNTENLDRVVDQLNLKYGKKHAVLGRRLQRAASARMAIAFNHIPIWWLNPTKPARRYRPTPNRSTRGAACRPRALPPDRGRFGFGIRRRARRYGAPFAGANHRDDVGTDKLLNEFSMRTNHTTKAVTGGASASENW